VAVRYPRGCGAWAPLRWLEALPFGKGEVRREGQGIAILAFGTLLYPALEAAERSNATVVNMRWAKPLDVELLLKWPRATTHDALVTRERVRSWAVQAVLWHRGTLPTPGVARAGCRWHPSRHQRAMRLIAGRVAAGARSVSSRRRRGFKLAKP
jgi:hypothetical protein